MVQELLDFKEKLDSTFEDAFTRNEKFVYTMKVLALTLFFFSILKICLFCVEAVLEQDFTDIRYSRFCAFYVI